MSQISNLTPKQQARLSEYADKWKNIGLSTEPAERAMAEDGIRLAYRLAGLPEPKKIIWCSSPMAGAITKAILTDTGASVGDSLWDSVDASVWNAVRASVGASVWTSVWNSVRASLRDSVWNSAWDSVGDSVRASLRDSVWDSVRASVMASVRTSVWNSVWDSVGDSVWDSVRDSVRDSVWNSLRDSAKNAVWDACYGQHDAPWLGFYEYFRDVCGLKLQTEKIAGLIQIARSAGWFWPYEKMCIVCERTSVVKQDSENRIHCEDGPAIAYPDGWSIYAIHGVRVPEYVVMRPHEITVNDIQQEQNAEIRRIKIDRYGQSRYLMDSGAKLVHEDDWGQLYKTELDNDEPLVMVKVVNSTPEPDGSYKDYFIRVPPTCSTALEAVAWTFGKEPSEYKTLVAQT